MTAKATPPKPAQDAPPSDDYGVREHGAAGGAESYPPSRPREIPREVSRIVFGIVLLFAIGVAALDVALWQHSAGRLEDEAWQRLEAATDVRRGEVDHLLDVFRREALSVAHDPYIASAVLRLRRAPSGSRRPASLDELFARAAEFDFARVAVAGGDGAEVASNGGTPGSRAAVDAQAARQALASGNPAWGQPGAGLLTLAVPVTAAGRKDRVIVFQADATRTLGPLLGKWPGFGESSGAYLVQAVGRDVEWLTQSPSAHTPPAGARRPMTRGDIRAATLAATRVSSRVVRVQGTDGPTVWAVTRPLAYAGWGLVGQADRAEMMSGMGSVRQLLLLLDLILAGVLLAIVLVWRRSYTAGLARHEGELTERHARRVQAILDTAFDAIFTFDRLGRVRSANRAAHSLVGLRTTEIEGRPIQRVLSWGTAAAPGGAGPVPLRGQPMSLPPTGAVVTGSALLPDGRAVPVEFSLGRSGEGDDLMYTAIVRDVRERVAAEQRVLAFAEGLENSNRRLEELNAQLEEASRLKSEFLANTSHELRTPLNGMIGFLQLVLDGMCDSREEETEFLKQALQCSRHLLGLINDVLDIARIEAGKLALDIGPLDLQQVFDEVYTVTHVQAAQKGLRLSFEDKVPAGVRARGDFGKIKQVLINLVGNSLKFTPKGEIRVRARAYADLGHVLIDVEDTGVGISSDRQSIVFEKFVQGDGSTTRRFGGTGLGLAISKSLIELMGGVIGISSDGQDRGTRVYFSLPLWRAEPSAPAPGPESTADRIMGAVGDPLVLVVEDDPVFRRFATAVLQRGGYRTVETDRAETAWMLVRRLQPAVVLLDYALACQEGAALRTGWDLAHRMALEDDTRHIPVVFVTGFDGELRERLQSTAFARRPEHMVKPVESAELVARISALAGGAKGSPVRVLLADDDATVSAYIRKVLPPERYLVEVANNGAECLHILRTQPNGFDVLLLDLMMPEVSGYDVLREMTFAGLHVDLPVLVLTNFPEPRNAEERRLLEEGLVLDVVAKTAVHANPHLLPQMLDWHLQAARGDAAASHEPPPGRVA